MAALELVGVLDSTGRGVALLNLTAKNKRLLSQLESERLRARLIVLPEGPVELVIDYIERKRLRFVWGRSPSLSTSSSPHRCGRKTSPAFTGAGISSIPTE